MSVNRGIYRLLKTYLYRHSVDNEGRSLSATYYGRVDVKTTDSVGRTPLSYAASNDDCRLLSILLRRNDIDVNRTDFQNHTLFFYAVYMGHNEAVQKLLADTRLNPNLASNNLSPLAIAANSDSTELLQMLLSDQRVTVNSQDHGSLDLLIWALFQRREGSCLRLLHAPNVDVNCSWDTISALIWGILLNHTAVAFEMLKKDQIDVSHQDDAGGTARMCAIEMENDEVSMALLGRKDTNLALENVRGESVLDYALKSNQSKMLAEIRQKLHGVAGSN
ncbi:ankyrin repeat-containing domain protein [Aspergillus arachidicola]|uniref:Ankyrin repeat-containing domain protein n=1 Tax=Aspergillus arachidicola TaxID=656916 RepID=A0A5N6YT97_9EURO|nr:ankyrin repeat-containing domain protein [Aspergillus arachidicola]